MIKKIPNAESSLESTVHTAMYPSVRTYVPSSVRPSVCPNIYTSGRLSIHIAVRPSFPTYIRPACLRPEVCTKQFFLSAFRQLIQFLPTAVWVLFDLMWQDILCLNRIQYNTMVNNKYYNIAGYKVQETDGEAECKQLSPVWFMQCQVCHQKVHIALVIGNMK